MWGLKTILYFGLFWVACLMALVNPIWGVVNYVMAYQTNPTSTWWGIPLTEMGMRFSMIAAVFTVVGLLVATRHVPRIRPVLSWWEVGLVAIVGIAALNLLVGYEYGASARHAFEKLWKMLLFVFILGRLAVTRRNFKIILWTFVVGSLYVGYDAYTAPPSSFWLGRLERIGGPDFSTTSGTAAHLGAMLPLIGAAFLIARRWPWRALAALAGAFTVNAIVLCRTRSAFVGLACGAVAALMVAPKARRFRIHAMLVAGAVVAFSLTDVHFWNRMNTLTSKTALSEDAATVSRTEIWRNAVHILMDHPQGVGAGNFPQVIGRYDPRYYRRSSHNTLLVCFTELGIQGGMVFLLMAVGSLYYLRRTVQMAADTDDPLETKLLVYGSLVSFITYFVTGLGTERFYCESFWWVFILPLCLYRMATSEAAAHALVPAGVPVEDPDDNDPVDARGRGIIPDVDGACGAAGGTVVPPTVAVDGAATSRCRTSPGFPFSTGEAAHGS
ncbi:MAG: O-antigen ligase family protein [Phycisphaerae bacterium]